MIGVGSKVKLNVGGPEMSVADDDGDCNVVVRWFDGNRMCGESVPRVCLVELGLPGTATDEIDDDWISDQVSHALKEAIDEAAATIGAHGTEHAWIARRAEAMAHGYIRERYQGMPDYELTMAVLREMAEQLLEDTAHLLRQAAETVAQAQSALHGGDLG